MPNVGEYLKSVHLKFRHCLGVSLIIIYLLITCILVEETDCEIGHFCNFRTLILDCVIWDPLTSIYTQNFIEMENGDGQTPRPPALLVQLRGVNLIKVIIIMMTLLLITLSYVCIFTEIH